MFKITVLCEDRKLQNVMWALDGLVVGMPEVIPVRGAKPNSNKTKVVSVGHGVTIQDRWLDLVRSHEGDIITRKELMALGQEAGYTKHSTATQINKKLVREKIIKRLEKSKFSIIR